MLIEPATQQFLGYLTMLERSQETIRSYHGLIKQFGQFLQRRDNAPVYVEDMTRDDVEQFLLYLKEEKKLQAKSRSHAQHTLSSFFKYLQGMELIRTNPTAMISPIRYQQKERGHLTEEEVYQLYDVMVHPVIRVMVLFLYYTGLRITEASQLTMDAVNLQALVVHVKKGKGNKDRLVPISTKLAHILSEYLTIRSSKVTTDRFFATPRTGKVSPQFVNRQLYAAAQQLGWHQHVTAHMLRHSYATALIERNVNIIHVSKLLGHSSVKTTSIYTHSKMDELRKAVEYL